eukprot:CAMPEP_0197037342 /NCGR_PEP_ID=MMETSP1384-20130603/14580_1 /TAXON_ID=29189 /ORGANISM="Ammonia sp." /LENGTH=280 /DNA_ID=CAMNT_0042467633 /DNA_START=23 /DNA_END=862 /DNA_ORIENTATION=+
MSSLPWLSVILYLSIATQSQEPELFVKIGNGASCEGLSGSLSEYGYTADEQISFDLNELYDSTGISMQDSSSNTQLQMSICGHIISEQSACATSEHDWCFEQTELDGTCIAGIARWEQSAESGNLIAYEAMFSTSDIRKDSVLGIRVSVLDFGQWHINCTNEHSIVNYDVLCSTASHSNWSHVSSNFSRCNWNVTVSSPAGCFEFVALDNGGGSTSDTQLSVGSVFLIIFVVALLTYCILGCAYNSFYHGREVMDAIPNKDSWKKLAKYTRAGCETTRDT